MMSYWRQKKLHEIEAAEKQEAAELRKMSAQRRMATGCTVFYGVIYAFNVHAFCIRRKG